MSESEALRVYRHFREVFSGGTYIAARARAARETESGSQPFTAGRDPKTLDQTLTALIADLDWTAPLAKEQAVLGWSDIVGEDVARHSAVVGLVDGVLQVRCESTAWATQLRHMRSQILAALGERFPDAGIDNIRFTGPDAPSWRSGPRSVPGRGPRDTYG